MICEFIRSQRAGRAVGGRSISHRPIPLRMKLKRASGLERLQHGQQAGQVVGNAGLTDFFGAGSVGHGCPRCKSASRPDWWRPGSGCLLLLGRNGILEQDADRVSHGLENRAHGHGGDSASTLTLVWVTASVDLRVHRSRCAAPAAVEVSVAAMLDILIRVNRKVGDLALERLQHGQHAGQVVLAMPPGPLFGGGSVGHGAHGV